MRRQYKETARPAGVYAVRNHTDDILLVGVSPDVPSMLNRQRFQLEMGVHPRKNLQEDWKRLGPSAFTFDILDLLEAPKDPEADMKIELSALLELWVAKLRSEGHGFYSGLKGAV